ncbi:hypothetical protein D3C87_1370920 [compost metagenome]
MTCENVAPALHYIGIGGVLKVNMPRPNITTDTGDSPLQVRHQVKIKGPGLFDRGHTMVSGHYQQRILLNLISQTADSSIDVFERVLPLLGPWSVQMPAQVEFTEIDVRQLSIIAR